MTREATDAEMLAAVERWAKARGFTRNRGAAWCVDAIAMQTGHRSGLLIQRRGSDGKYSDAWENVDPHTALLWALSVEAGITVDVGRCPVCDGEGVRLAWADWPGVSKESKRAWGRKCHDCNGTGRDMREVARLVLDAAPRGWVAAGEDCSPLCDDDCERCGRGDPQARDHIDVVADKLQGPGEPLGLWYALWLAGKRDNTADAVGHLHAAALRHELINYPGQSDDRADAWTAAWELVTVPCERCEETGRVTTHHTPVPGAGGELAFAALELPGPGPAARSRACPDCGGHGRVRSERG